MFEAVVMAFFGVRVVVDPARVLEGDEEVAFVMLPLYFVLLAVLLSMLFSILLQRRNNDWNMRTEDKKKKKKYHREKGFRGKHITMNRGRGENRRHRGRGRHKGYK